MKLRLLTRTQRVLLTNGLAMTTWGRRILRAEKRGHFSGLDRIEAADWVTCACGRVTADIPLSGPESTHPYKPVDAGLVTLGELFNDQVHENNPLKSARYLVEIEKRAQEVVNQ